RWVLAGNPRIFWKSRINGTKGVFMKVEDFGLDLPINRGDIGPPGPLGKKGAPGIPGLM
ncbi:Collagen alpha-1(XXI) chain, partial [Manis javanica]